MIIKLFPPVILAYRDVFHICMKLYQLVYSKLWIFRDATYIYLQLQATIFTGLMALK